MKKRKKSIPAPRGPRLRAVTHSGVQARVHPMGGLALGCDMFAPKGRLEWYHGSHQLRSLFSLLSQTS